MGVIESRGRAGTARPRIAGQERAVVEHTDTVTFHAVGDEEPRSHRLVELERIVLG